jgi:hypothetical protein
MDKGLQMFLTESSAGEVSGEIASDIGLKSMTGLNSTSTTAMGRILFVFCVCEKNVLLIIDQWNWGD